MALPGDVTTCTVTFGPYLDVEGQPLFAGMTGSVTPSWTTADTATGAVILDVPTLITISAAGSASIVLPHTDQSGLVPSNFTYVTAWQRGRNATTPTVRRFSLPQEVGSAADYDLMVLARAEAGPSVYIPVVADAAVAQQIATGPQTQAIVKSTAVAAVGGEFVVHGTNAAQTRPVTTLPVVWFGSVDPVNADDALDVWIPVSADGGADSLASLQAALAAKADLAAGVVPDAELPARLQDAALRAAYVSPLPTVGSLAYNGDGTIASDADGNTYTWNTDGTPATQTKGGITRTFHWNTDGTLAGVS